MLEHVQMLSVSQVRFLHSARLTLAKLLAHADSSAVADHTLEMKARPEHCATGLASWVAAVLHMAS